MKPRSILLAAMIAALPVSLLAQEAPKSATLVQKAPGTVNIVDAVELQGVITAIDKKNRVLGIRGGSGSELTIAAGQEVKNFNKIKVGDLVTLSYVAALGLDLKKGGGRLRQRSESEQDVSAEPGERPGAARGQTIRVIADVSAVDAAAGTITLRGPQRTVDLVVKDKELLKDIRVGDQIAATYQEAIAVAVTPAPPPPAPDAAPAAAAAQ